LRPPELIIRFRILGKRNYELLTVGDPLLWKCLCMKEQSNQLETKLIYAADIDIEQFRFLAQKNLKNPRDLVLVNYRRPALKQTGGGHISPIAAYHQPSDRFLILDVAAYRYPPVWVRTEELWKGINSLDQTSNRSRGLIAVQG
jgi:Phytochelatin synthase